MTDKDTKLARPSLLSSLLAGSVGGICTDIVLFPLDTIKTRAQSQLGFQKSGGYSGLFRGVGSAALGSAPSGASFFFTYELVKRYVPVLKSPVISHMTAACVAESVACVVRIPFEVVKQTAQASGGLNSLDAFKFVVKHKGIFGLGQGFFSMVSREIPFTLIQFPLWEYLKTRISGDLQCPPLASAVCGSFAGGFAAALTTPMDVAKTRIILSQGTKGMLLEKNPYKVILTISKNEGIPSLFSGIAPRVMWVSLGGFIFFGSYEKAKEILYKFDV